MTPILVCESLRAPSLAGLVRARDAAAADLVELRLDALAEPDPEVALAGRTHPVIVTCRPKWEGGGFDGPEEVRFRLLETALKAGAEFVDVEWHAPWRDECLARWADRVVLSWHDFTTIPAVMSERVQAMSRTRAAVVKVAVTPARLRDLEVLLAMRRAIGRERRVVVIGMGAAGLPTRLLPQRFGSCWTYGGDGVAPGQVPADRLIREFRVRAVTGETAVFASLAHPAVAGLDSAVHNAAFAAAGIDAVHVPLDIVDEADLDWAADVLDLVGVSTARPLAPDAGLAASHPLTGGVFRRDGRGGWTRGRPAEPPGETDLDAVIAGSAATFEYWTGAVAPLEAMRVAARRYAGAMAGSRMGPVLNR